VSTAGGSDAGSSGAVRYLIRSPYDGRGRVLERADQRNPDGGQGTNRCRYDPGRSGQFGDLQREVYGLARVFNWSYVTQPSLHPPTPTHRQRFERFQNQLRTATTDLDALVEKARRALD